MKVLIATPHYPPKYIGGTEQIAYRTAHALTDRGHQVSVVSVESIQANEDEPFCLTQEEAGVKVHRLHFQTDQDLNFHQSSYRNEQVQSWLSQFLLEEKPDIVHLLSGYLISASVLEAAYALQIAVVVTLLDYWFVCPRITLLRSNGDICPEPVPPSRCAWCKLSRKRRFRVPDEKLRGIPGNAYTLLGKYRPVTRIMGMENEIHAIDDRREYLKQMLEQADAVISHSQFLQEKIRENGIFTDNVVYLPNGIDFDEVKATGPAKTPRAVRIGYIGQIAQHKGVHVLIDAFLAIHAAPEEAELHIYGDGSRWPEYTAFLQQKAKNHPGIFFKDSFAASQVGNVLDSLDVLVVPSIWFENRPTVILEAFSRRKPVIVSDLGGMVEMVQHDVDGLRFKAGDAYHLSVMLHRIVEDPALLDDLAASIQPVKTISDEIDEIEQLYAKILKTRQPLSAQMKA